VRDNDIVTSGVFTLPVIVTPPPAGQGTVTVNAAGNVVYDPGTFVGTTTFTYRLADGANPSLTDEALVTVKVAPIVDAVDDSFYVAGGVTTVLPVENNDFSYDPALPVPVVTVEPQHGTVGVLSNGVVSYTSTTPGYLGTDTFTYQITDPTGNYTDT